MRRIVLLLGITALAAISLAQCTLESTGGGKSNDAVVHVLGTPGLKFTGSIGAGASIKSVEGTVPKSFTLKSTMGIFVAVIQKSTESGDLSVVVECGNTSPTQSTSAAYGVVSVSCVE